MSGSLLGFIGFGAALGLIALGFPVAVAMAVVGVAGFWWLNGWTGAAFILGSSPFEAIFPYSLSVVPLFVMMGVFAARAGLSRSLFEMVNSFLGHIRGGLAVTAVGACAIFGAICGSSLATVATMGRVAIPEMNRHGYHGSLSSASIAAGGTLGVLIPPSILLVIYGILTQTSIGQLFIGAIIPGIIGAVLYGLAIIFRVKFAPDLAPPTPRATWRQRLTSVRRIWGVALLFALVIGGIYVGWFSPTEAAAVGAVGAFVLAVISRELTRKSLWDAVRETAALTGMIFFILIGASLFNYFLETTGLPAALINGIEASGLSPTMVLILIMLFYVILGCFMDAMSMILLTVPFLAPVALSLGFDMVWFGILVVTVAEIGLITPPIGMNLFVVQATQPGLTQRMVVRGILPFILADVVRLVILASIPALALWLPSRMF
ncbi:TRAP-type C4-dicarboxylate transport system, large permease component [Caenispirillum salinarum AK4]|uniref:TRAP transporter large permease protein n=1 Tax=Caenispirillum salinarum AK4 TaxID=1238182 RepID=K9GNK5_9PROT|nr:TRAP transporter large permease [Caenispirillum salinarum]EKV26647.1 TRAP-type C4-dicarboxylate transport system, large permease component [Caenispirillum salinarum AK4]